MPAKPLIKFPISNGVKWLLWTELGWANIASNILSVYRKFDKGMFNAGMS